MDSFFLIEGYLENAITQWTMDNGQLFPWVTISILIMRPFNAIDLKWMNWKWIIVVCTVVFAYVRLCMLRSRLFMYLKLFCTTNIVRGNNFEFTEVLSINQEMNAKKASYDKDRTEREDKITTSAMKKGHQF